MKPKVMIDPGHGGHDPGAVNDTVGIQEKDINLTAGLYCRRHLLHTVGDHIVPLLTRKEDKFLYLNERCEKAKEFEVDSFVSLHVNSWEEPHVQGFEVYYFNKKAKKLAETIHEWLSISLPGHTDRGVKKMGYYVLRHSVPEAVLVEYEFISNPAQATWLSNIENQKRYGVIVSDALRDYYLCQDGEDG